MTQEHDQHPLADEWPNFSTEWDIRFILSRLKCWHRLTDEESEDLILFAYRRGIGRAQGPGEPLDAHPDDAVVDAFAQVLKEKLAASRAKGRDGWQTCPPEVLSRMLREHVDKGDPRDVAIFAMFLWTLGSGISPQAAS